MGAAETEGAKLTEGADDGDRVVGCWVGNADGDGVGYRVGGGVGAFVVGDGVG